MKRIITHLILGIGFTFTVGCSSDEDTVPYYRFSAEDETLLIKYNYITDQVITYENQYNEKLHFKVVSNTRQKSRYSLNFANGILNGGASLQNYYDSKIIRLEILENSSVGFCYNVNYVFSKNRNEFKSGINFPLWNVALYAFIDESQNDVNMDLGDYYMIPRTQMIINGKEFSNIIIIDSNSMDSNEFCGGITQNVNSLYYDYDFGIVQFNTTDGNEWKVIYPD
ncbi:hypothetical protein ES692_07540 [Psychroserpens burtonensis]|uniref:Uncharacterized protein n=1 Tax=Psychroserpens burtonensis TaxID=49278 RepID=A0A5C7B7K3_9FLAO|nr:hypothetical protein [Psychroserpens burtonensis]TXE18090.1 hypothetical protein ES692_07540 [Psychroserpens burtonensis]